jgi:hypothetical protein
MTPAVAIETMTGSEVTYTVPSDVKSVTFQARDSTIQMRTTSGSTGYVSMGPLQPFTFEDTDLPGKVFYFTGTNAKILEVLTVTIV